MSSAAERIDDWEALCNWLEEQPYNASYHPSGRGAYLLTGFYSPHKTISVDDPDAPPLLIGGRRVLRKKDIPNPDLAKEKDIARRCREIVLERRRLGLVFWSTGHGWRLHSNYRETIAAERARLAEQEH
jgi:hypothetical protein